jgi:hypothetical protein
VVEVFDTPTEGYAVDFPVPDHRVVGRNRWENVMITPTSLRSLAPITVRDLLEPGRPQSIETRTHEGSLDEFARAHNPDGRDSVRLVEF